MIECDVLPIEPDLESDQQQPAPAKHIGSKHAAATLCLSVATGCGPVADGATSSRTPHAEVMATTTAYLPSVYNPHQEFDIYSITVVSANGKTARGFSPVKQSVDQLGSAVLGGWNILHNATHGALEPGAIHSETTSKVHIPGINKGSDLCDDGKRNTLKASLLDMAKAHEKSEAKNAKTAASKQTGDKPIIPVFVIETNEDELPKGCALSAEAGPGAGILAYISRYVVPNTMGHEAAHTQGLDHDTSEVNGSILEYGNNGTLMGNQNNYADSDPDALNAFDLLALKAIKPNQIVTVPIGSTRTIELSTVSSTDGGTVAIRIPTGPVGGAKADKRLRCTTSVYLELDTNALLGPNGTAIDRVHGIEAYAVDERARTANYPLKPQTVLLLLEPGDYTQAYNTDVPIAVRIGNGVLNLSVADISKRKAQVTITLASSSKYPAPSRC